MQRKTQLGILSTLLLAIWSSVVLLRFLPGSVWVQHITYSWRTLEALGAIDLALLAVILSIGGSLGHWVLARARIEFDRRNFERTIFAVALGLGILSYLTFLLGCLQLFKPAIVQALLVAAVIVLAPAWFSALRNSGIFLRTPNENWTVATGVAFTLGTVFSLVYLMAALTPETEFDALNYHLGISKLFITTGGIHPLPHLVYSNFPLNTEMLYVLGELTHSTLLAKLFHFAFAMLAAGAIASFGSRFLSLPVGIWGSAVFLASPLVGYLTKTAYVDLAVTLYTFLSLYAFYISLTKPNKGWLVLAGTFSGLAFGAKYTGLFVVVVITCLNVGFYIYRKFYPNGARLQLKRPGSLWIAYYLPILILAAPWLIKNIVFTGNPVAPLLSNLLQNPDFRPTDYNVWMESLRSWRGFEGGWGDILRGPWLFTQYSDTFGGNPGIVFLLFLPFAAWWGWRNKTLRFLLLCALISYCFLVLGTKQLRFYVPLFPLLSLIIAGGVFFKEKERPPGGFQYPRRIALIVLTVLLILQLPLFSPLWNSHRLLTLNPDSIRLFTSEQERFRYQEKSLSGNEVLELHDYLNQEIPSGGSGLALTAGYQALLSHPLYLLPNSASATELTRQFLEAALTATGFIQIELALADRARYRRWRIETARHDPVGWKSYRPRIFDRAGTQTLEHFLLATQPVPVRGRSVLELDLGTPQWVGIIQFWEPLESDPEDLANSVSLSAHDGTGWLDVEFTLKLDLPSPAPAEMLARSCRKVGVTHIFFRANHEHLGFLSEFFGLPSVEAYFHQARRVGDFHVQKLRD